ncbi:MAG TPA: hypothetical protein VGQ72_10145 [Pyrinomonadaceae bacterium]|nr:hypothetical protein [Pyrinomonadaceae bacterium]
MNDKPMLHVHNGDSSAMTARKANLPGEHFAWREALVCGPAPGGLPEQEFLSVRAQHLSSAYDVDVEKCLAELREQHDAVARFFDHEEVVLWFEHDLFCQVQLIYLLNWFSRREIGKTKLSLICVGEFPGVQFHGLGQLNEEQLSSLFPHRQAITAEQLSLGARAWQAYSSAEAADLITLRDSDTSALPFLKTAISKHLQRFPSTRNGLGRIENAALDLIARGYREFKSLFPAFIGRERDYGFGDAQFHLVLRRMSDARRPLLRGNNGDRSTLDSESVHRSAFEITEAGEAVLSGATDFVALNGIDLWLGGVHLREREAAWRWDDEAQSLVTTRI